MIRGFASSSTIALVSLGCALGSSANFAAAQTRVYTNMDTTLPAGTNAWNPNPDFSLVAYGLGYGSSTLARHAQAFTPSATGQFMWLSLVLDSVSSIGNTATISILSDNNGLPGTILYSATSQAAGNANGGWLPGAPMLNTVLFDPANPLTLAAGTRYWVAISINEEYTRMRWWASTIDITSPFATFRGTMGSNVQWALQSSPGVRRGAFEVYSMLPPVCDAPIGSAEAALDSDGDMRVDSCSVFTQTNDCDGNRVLDSGQTLVFSDSDFSTAAGAQPWSPTGNTLILPNEGLVQLTPANYGQAGALVRAPLTTGPTERFRAIFDFRCSDNSGLPADGISFSLMDADLYSTNVLFGEDGLWAPGVLTVKFNTFANSAEEGSNSMFIRYNGADIASNLALPFQLADSQWHRAVVDLTPDGRVTVKIGTNPSDFTTVFNNVQMPGYTPKRFNVGFGGRTGGSFSRHCIKNVRLGVNGPNDLNANGVPDSCECEAATIMSQPEAHTACSSTPTYFAVEVSGTEPLTYEWRKNGSPIDATVNPTAANATLTLSGLTFEDVGTYSCFVTNACGSDTSDAVTLTICIGDFNCDGGVDGEDVGAFFSRWESGDVSADVNADGGVDGGDVNTFFEHWEAGC